MLPSFRHLAFFCFFLPSLIFAYFLPPGEKEKRGQKQRQADRNALLLLLPQHIRRKALVWWTGSGLDSPCSVLADVSEGCWTEPRVPTLTERRPSRAGGGERLSSRIVRHLHRSPFASCPLPPSPRPRSEETWQPPQRSTRPVSPRCRFSRPFHATFGLSEPSVFVRCGGAATGRRSLAAEAWPPASIPFPPPRRRLALDAAILSAACVHFSVSDKLPTSLC